MSIRGEKRKQLIEQWLRGEDNPEYEVRPTRREGRYIVTKRSQPAPDPSHGEPVKSGITSAEQIEPAPELVDGKPTHGEPVKSGITFAPRIEHAKTCITSAEQIESVDRDISLTILRELRMLGEDNRKRMERKEAKKEVKYHEYEYEYEYEYEDEPVKPVKPIYVRRRLNLLSKYM